MTEAASSEIRDWPHLLTSACPRGERRRMDTFDRLPDRARLKPRLCTESQPASTARSVIRGATAPHRTHTCELCISLTFWAARSQNNRSMRHPIRVAEGVGRTVLRAHSGRPGGSPLRRFLDWQSTQSVAQGRPPDAPAIALPQLWHSQKCGLDAPQSALYLGEVDLFMLAELLASLAFRDLGCGRRLSAVETRGCSTSSESSRRSRARSVSSVIRAFFNQLGSMARIVRRSIEWCAAIRTCPALWSISIRARGPTAGTSCGKTRLLGLHSTGRFRSITRRAKAGSRSKEQHG